MAVRNVWLRSVLFRLWKSLTQEVSGDKQTIPKVFFFMLYVSCSRLCEADGQQSWGEGSVPRVELAGVRLHTQSCRQVTSVNKHPALNLKTLLNSDLFSQITQIWDV